MENSQVKYQRRFFNDKNNRYGKTLILNPPLHTKLELDQLIKLLKKEKIKKVLDFGSGDGRFSIPLLQNKYDVYAVDISKKSLQDLKKLATQLGFSSLKTSTIFPNKMLFDAVVGTDILHHVDIPIYLNRIYKTLKKGGVIVFSEPGSFNLAWYIYLTFFRNWEAEKGIIQCSYFNFLRQLSKAGFTNIELRGLGLVPRPFFNFFNKLCRLNDFLGNLPILKYFAYRYIITAKK